MTDRSKLLMKNNLFKLNATGNKGDHCDIPLEQAKHYIASIDFSMIINKLVQLGWLRTDAEKTCKLYRNYLFLNKKFGSKIEKFSPSIEIDEFWHYHILDTKKYHDDCINIFGSYLHHEPTYPGRNGDDEKTPVKLRSAFNDVQFLHFQEYGEYIEATRTSRPKIITFIIYHFLKLLNIGKKGKR